MLKNKTAHYKIVTDSGGTRRNLSHGMSGAVLCTVKAYAPENVREGGLAWKNESIDK